ncbi:MAG TPA: FAD-dependent oxidoreductase [Candidatus Obscuribacterales bacterium]
MSSKAPAAKNSSPASGKAKFRLVDVQSLNVDKPLASVRSVAWSKPDETIECDVLVVGGGVGGISAALSALTFEAASTSHKPAKTTRPLRICLTEETDWVGGQMTSQGVSALDENPLVETSGASSSYQQLRRSIREFYRTNFKLDCLSAADPWLNPGDCWVSWLAFEPKVALAQINDLLKPHQDKGNLSLFLRHKPLFVKTRRHGRSEQEKLEVLSVGMLDLNTNKCLEFQPKLCLDATELGDLLPLAELPYRTGAESREETGEPHAPEVADPENVQDFTYPFVVEFRPGENHTIAKPQTYDEFKAKGKFSFQGYKMFDCKLSGDGDDLRIDTLPFWEYRRLIAKEKFLDAAPFDNDLAMINWDSNDLRGENIIDQEPEVQAERLALGKAVSLGFLYWLQTEAPRNDGEKGYPELLLREDILGTGDGLSKYPYIRESRRIIPQYTLVEQDIVIATNAGARAKHFSDSVGIGHYPVDIHGKQDVPGAGQRTRPFQIPLSSLLPKDAVNLLPCCKNIGTTHVTNGAYRLHPIEWSIGEAQGALAAFALAHDLKPEDVLNDKAMLSSLQRHLVRRGVPIYWYNDVPTNHPAFEAVQILAIEDLMPGDSEHLRFYPDKPISRAQAADVLFKLFAPVTAWLMPSAPADAAEGHPQREAIAFCLGSGLMRPTGDFKPEAPLLREDLESIAKLPQFNLTSPHCQDREVTRAQFALWAYNAMSLPQLARAK